MRSATWPNAIATSRTNLSRGIRSALRRQAQLSVPAGSDRRAFSWERRLGFFCAACPARFSSMSIGFCRRFRCGLLSVHSIVVVRPNTADRCSPKRGMSDRIVGRPEHCTERSASRQETLQHEAKCCLDQVVQKALSTVLPLSMRRAALCREPPPCLAHPPSP